MSYWSVNSPSRFWRLRAQLGESDWDSAVAVAVDVLPPEFRGLNITGIITQTLGEEQFGPDHWQLSTAKRLYYLLKPIIPRIATRFLRQLSAAPARASFPLDWPIEDRYARFMWEVMRQMLSLTGNRKASFVNLWPDSHYYALVLTHDIENAKGQAHVRAVADLEESLGFRSSFNFVCERYPLDQQLMQELRLRGFEIGVHGLKHDGKLFSSYSEFSRRADRINHYLKEFGAVGFRAPLTHRHPGWMQKLEIEYDLSFFDTDPFEPIPGGSMSIWPYYIGHFIELPYTLVQDYTLAEVLGETTPDLWLHKVDFIEKYHGMALLNSHPDYLRNPSSWAVYTDFLLEMKARDNYWHALPREVATWWRRRSNASSLNDLPGAVSATAQLIGDEIVIKDVQER